ncbi:MAG: gamma carbonic anhydrase family protein [Spirochaetaceae bacterium 4572_59]|nr:MAG: gamma carbonic anhydrase family protein [Spirochaetaceae bacterium 4572_59]
MIYKLNGKVPKISGKVGFIAASADIIGDVSLDEGVSIWFNAVLRGDLDEIRIGENSNIQDCAVVHTDKGYSCQVGKAVTVGHGAVLHGCKIGDNCLVGMNSVVLNGAEIGDNCLIGANSLVSQGAKIPSGSLLLGSPAKVVKELKPSMIEAIQSNGMSYVNNSSNYLDTLKEAKELLE